MKVWYTESCPLENCPLTQTLTLTQGENLSGGNLLGENFTGVVFRSCESMMVNLILFTEHLPGTPHPFKM